MLVNVTRADIKNARNDYYPRSQTCPVARAIARALRRAGTPGDVRVTTTGYAVQLPIGARTPYVALPQSVREFVSEFDGGATPKPIRFRIRNALRGLASEEGK